MTRDIGPSEPSSWLLRSADSGTLVVPHTITTLGYVRFGHKEQPPLRTVDFITVHKEFTKKLKKIMQSAASASEDCCLTVAI